MIQEHLQEFGGKTVVDWEPGTALPDAAGTLARISLDYDDYESTKKWLDKFAAFLDDDSASQIAGLVVGPWDYEMSVDSSPIVAALVESRDRLPNLTTLFIGDILSEENEISWIQQGDVSPLFAAFPNLEHFGVRGGDGLSIGSPQHEHLKSLVIQTGGLDAGIVHALTTAHLPQLEHLELWLGTDDYGGTTTVQDLEPILSGRLFPKLRSLGLCDSDIADQVAQAVALAPVLERIRVLDLSLGTLGDEGAQALLSSPLVAKLEKLDIHYHFCSDETVEQLKAALPNVEVDASDSQKPDLHGGESYRYVAVGE